MQILVSFRVFRTKKQVFLAVKVSFHASLHMKMHKSKFKVYVFNIMDEGVLR